MHKLSTRFSALWRSCRPALLLAGFVLAISSANAELPPGYPASYQAIVSAARHEGKVVIYSTTDASAVSALIQDFKRLYPGIEVSYNDMNSDEIYPRVVAEAAAKQASADVVWSSAMDLQMKLANDGFAARYRSPEADALPAWSIWRETAYGTTFEPAVIVYNKRRLSAAEVPQTHADLLNLLTKSGKRFVGNITTYDVSRSGLGFLLATQDNRVQASFWELAKAFGNNAVELERNTSVMMQRIAAGKYYLGYNLIGSYALSHAMRDPTLGVVLPKDYTLVLSRIALLSKTATHPNAGKLWLDYLLSKRGQTILSSKSELFAIRDDVPGEFTAAALRQNYPTQLKAIAVAPPLVVYLDQAKRHEFLKKWNQAIAPASP